MCRDDSEILCLKLYTDQSEKMEVVGQVNISLQDKDKTGCRIHCNDIKPLIDSPVFGFFRKFGSYRLFCFKIKMKIMEVLDKKTMMLVHVKHNFFLLQSK